MKYNLCLFLGMLLAFPALCAEEIGNDGAGDAPVSGTIRTTPELDLAVLRNMFGSRHWHQVVDMPYDHYVIFNATVRKDRSLRIHRVETTFPDDSRLELARQFARNARLAPVTVGTRVAPSAKICVVFFEKGNGPKEALVYAELTSMAAAAGRTGGTEYLNIFYYHLD